MLDKLVDLLINCIRVFAFFDVVDPYMGGVVLRLGRYHRMAKPGWNWIWPLYIERVLTTNVVTETIEVGPQSLITKDWKQVVVTTVLTFTKEDVKTFLLTISGGDRVIDEAAPGVIAGLIMSHTFEELMEMDMENELTKAVRRFSRKYGVSIQRVQIKDFAICKSLRLLQSMIQTFPIEKEF